MNSVIGTVAARSWAPLYYCLHMNTSPSFLHPTVYNQSRVPFCNVPCHVNIYVKSATQLITAKLNFSGFMFSLSKNDLMIVPPPYESNHR
ncbi:hypothetical protein L1887_04655 [Cichorium endivia]|nr:hypothetical protein L1887_04655 [Cichorium endivia]